MGISARVVKIGPDGIVRLIAGKANEAATTSGGGITGFGGDGDQASNALLNNPSGIAVDSSGNIYISDTNNASARSWRTVPRSPLRPRR